MKNDAGFKKGHEKFGGRKKGVGNKISQKLFEEFLETIKEVEADQKISAGKTFFKHIISRSFKNDMVAISLLRKLIPDRTFSLEELQGDGKIRVVFEIIDALKKDEKEKENKEEN